MGKLTRTFIVKDMKLDCLKSRLLKNGLIQFMDVASKVQNALQKIYGRIPEEIVIHVDAFFSTHAITRVNYWEFFMHLNPMVRKLKIVIVLNRILNNKLENCSLCESCSSKEKELSVKFLAKSYDDFMLDENYQKPNILFYVQVEECNSEKVKKWSEFNFPVVLRFESDSNFSKTPQFLALSTKFRFIYDGQIKAPFSTLSSIENKDYFIIFQSKENKGKSFDLVTGENCGEKIGTSTIETSSIVEDINSENLNSAENIADVLKITSSELNDNSDSNEKSKVETKGNQSAIVSLPEANVKDNSENLNSAENIANASKIHSSESKDNSDNNEKLKLETKENLAVTVYLPEANRILIQNENTNTETEVEKNSNNKKTELTENKNSNIPAEPAVHTSNDEQKEQKFEDKIFSPSSSLICPLVIISKPEEEEKEKKEEEVEKNTAIENSKHEENNCSNSKSIDNESLEIEDDEEKNEEKNNTELIEKLRVEKEEQKNNIEFRVNLENFSYSQTNFSQSFLIDHISYLNHENEELRKRLNASIEEVAKQQIKFEQIFSTVIEENKLMKKVLRDIVNIADIDLQLKKS
ncbi:putative uncharacterized protein DDB_G0282133 isoform X2 [Leptopilina heterotoma]|nr:putative uncharacterized protein DDB_G0282133 isoform X2 [Leptopilina heterotoma]XP_043478082.1 putative uncharacterized protein DDB_G0282133 isoform X2 [Leptopilina heterotoma]